MKRLMSVIAVLLMASACGAALTKTGSQVDAWAAVLEAGVRIGGETDISDCFAATLYIDMALTVTDLHEGTEIIVQTSAATSGTEDWSDLTRILALADRSATAADTEATVGAITDANTVIDVADTDAGKWETGGGKWFFLLDGTVANSEMLMIETYANDHYIDLVDKPTRAHDSGSAMWDTAERYQVSLPFGANRVRVIYNNNYDNDGTAAQIHCHSHIVQVTSLE